MSSLAEGRRASPSPYIPAPFAAKDRPSRLDADVNDHPLGRAIVAGSHKLIGEFLQRREPAGCSYMRLFWYAHWVYNGIAALGLGRSGRTPMEVVQAAPCRAVSRAIVAELERSSSDDLVRMFER